MTQEQTAHMDHLNSTFTSLNTQKYKAGVKEHKTNLWDVDILPLLYNMREEILDAFNYIQTAIDEFEK